MTELMPLALAVLTYYEIQRFTLLSCQDLLPSLLGHVRAHRASRVQCSPPLRLHSHLQGETHISSKEIPSLKMIWTLLGVCQLIQVNLHNAYLILC